MAAKAAMPPLAETTTAPADNVPPEVFLHRSLMTEDIDVKQLIAKSVYWEALTEQSRRMLR